MERQHDHYIIRGGVEGRERLRVISRVLRPTTLALLERVEVRAGLSCLDAGCGGGDVAVELARLVGPGGRVVGTDLDEAKLDLARGEAAAQGLTNVEFRRADVVATEDGAYDLVYARFLLSHLPDPAGGLAKLRRAVRPGGMIAVEDVDHSGCFCHPDNAAYQGYVDLYTQTAARRGCDANLGRRLPTLLIDGGFAAVGVNVVQPAALAGDAKHAIALTLENVAPAILAEGLAEPDQMDRMIDDLYAFARDPRALAAFPRIVQVWGKIDTVSS
jgi:SAM-dependent methyltransferase